MLTLKLTLKFYNGEFPIKLGDVISVKKLRPPREINVTAEATKASGCKYFIDSETSIKPKGRSGICTT